MQQIGCVFLGTFATGDFFADFVLFGAHALLLSDQLPTLLIDRHDFIDPGWILAAIFQ
jgi:hypothetical protein